MDVNDAIFEAMQEGRPYKTYRKSILSKLRVWVLNPFSGEADEKIISGQPGEESTLINLWSTKEDVFFKRMNKYHFEKGYLIEVKAPAPKLSEEEFYNALSDEKLDELLNSPFKKFEAAMNKMTSVAPLNRLLALAEEQEKSDKLVGHIKARLSEIQELEFTNAS